MKFNGSEILLIGMIFVIAGCAPAGPEQSSEEMATPAASVPGYHPVEGWPQAPEGWEFGEVAGVTVDHDGDVWLFTRGEHPLIEFRADGTFVRSLLEGTVTRAHFVRIDSDNNVWVTDAGNHTVTKLDHEGNVLLSLGEKGKEGEDESHFNAPCDVAFAPNGDFFVADGHAGSRVVKFDGSGKFIKAWGKKGTGQEEFDVPHAVQVGPDGRVYVADRENSRIQIFDLDGNFIEMWTHLGTPYGLTIAGDRLYMTDGRLFKVIIADLEGNLLGSFGSEGSGPGQFNPPHTLAVAPSGEIYVAEPRNHRAQKFTPGPAEGSYPTSTSGD